MNKILKWFHERDLKRLNIEMDEKGLMIKDEEKFKAYTRKVSRKNLIYNFLFIVIIILFILRWMEVF